MTDSTTVWEAIESITVSDVETAAKSMLTGIGIGFLILAVIIGAIFLRAWWTTRV